MTNSGPTYSYISKPYQLKLLSGIYIYKGLGEKDLLDQEYAVFKVLKAEDKEVFFAIRIRDGFAFSEDSWIHKTSENFSKWFTEPRLATNKEIKIVLSELLKGRIKDLR